MWTARVWRRHPARLAAVLLCATASSAYAAAAAAAAGSASELTCGPPHCPFFVFAIHNNTLHARVFRTFGDRAWHTLYLMLALLERRRVPDVYGSMGNIYGDGLSADVPDPESHFAFYRTPGASLPLLWPDFDHSGSVQKFIAPHELLAEQLAAAAPPWEHRADVVFWTGNVHRGALRKKYARCAAANDGVVRVDEYDGQWDAGKYSHLARGVALKPVRADLRKLTRYKYLIYLPGTTWSSSLKRLMLAGAVVILPNNDPHETLLTHVMRDCDDCFLYYDIRDICGSLLRLMAAVDDGESRLRAQRLAEYMRSRVTTDAMFDWMSAQLQTAAAAQADRRHVLEGVRLSVPRVTCATAKSWHADAGDPFQLWQLDEWYDDACDVKPAPYLATTAV